MRHRSFAARISLAALVVLAFLGLAHLAPAATNDLSGELQSGLFEEEANHNLTGAIQAYQTVAAQFDKDRKLAATAIFRLGECYRKQGATNEAAAYYQRILRDFSEQATLVNLSRQNLTALGAPAGLSNPQAGAQAGDAAAARAEAKSLKAQLERLAALKVDDQRVAVQQAFPNPVMTALMQRLAEAEQNLVGLRIDYGPQYAEVRKVEAQVQTLTNQIDAQVQGALRSLSAQVASAEAKAQALSAAAASRQGQGEGPAGSEAAASTSTEAEEVKRIQEMIKDSPDLINAKDPQTGATPLHNAATKGQLVVAQFLLENGAEVDARDRTDRTPLHDAAFAGHKAMAELLLSHHAQVGATSIGRTPLHLAAERGFRSVAELLLDHGADINAKTRSGTTPLLLAVANGFAPAAELLLNRGADVNATSSDIDIDTGRKFYGAALHVAAQRGDLPMTELLLSKKPNVDLEDGKGRTPLSYAAEAKSAPVMKALLAAHANPNAGRLDMPLSQAAYNGDLPSLELLLANGADARTNTVVDWWVHSHGTQRQGGSFSPLFLAVAQNHPEAARQLLRAGADPNQVTPDGALSIFETLHSEHTNLLEALLAGGADPERRNRDGTSPLEAAINRDSAPEVQILLAHHADANAVTHDGSTPLLHFAAAYGRDGIVKLLLEHGADVNARNANDGATALFYAVQNNHPATVKLLLEHKADPNLRNNAGNTPLDAAKRFVLAAANGVSYQWNPTPGLGPPGGHPPGAQSSAGSSPPPSMTGLLLQHGAVEDLPHLDRIEVRRPSTGYSNAALTKNTNDWSQFTLLEVLAMQYRFLAASPGELGHDTYSASAFVQTFGRLPFPDFAHLRIRRPGADSKSWQQQTVDFRPVLDAGDCAKDQLLAWGDVVEIAEADHPLNEPWQGFFTPELANLKKCLTRHVQVIVKNQATTFTLAPDIRNVEATVTPTAVRGEGMHWAPGERPSFITEPTIFPRTSFWLRDVLLASKLVLASSDLSRIKVSRKDPATGRKQEWVVDCGSSKPSPDLWLRDGDIIEVPDRP